MGGGVETSILQLFHYKNANEAIEKWKERVERIQPNCPILVKKTIMDDEDAYRFSELPFERKVGFYYKNLNLPNIVYLKGWEDSTIRHRYNWNFRCYVRDSLLPVSGFFQFSVMDLFGSCPNLSRIS